MMDNPNITMEEYIRLEEEKARRRGKVYNWEIASYGKIWYDEDVHNLRSVETEFPAIVFNEMLSSEKTLSCEPTVSSPNNNEIDFRISFDKSDDEDYTVVFDKNSFSYKIIVVNDLKMDSENDNEKVNMLSFPLPEPMVSCFDDLDFFEYVENEFPAIVYNDALTSKSDFLIKPTLSPQHINEFDLKNETSLSEYDEVEQNVLYFIDLFPFNIIYPDDLRSDKDNDDNEIDIIQFSGGNVNTQGQKKFLEASHDKINKNVAEAKGQSMFTSRAWRLLFDIRGPLVHELILEFFIHLVLEMLCFDLYTARALQFSLGGRKGISSTRGSECLLDRGSHFGGFSGIPPSYTPTGIYTEGMEVGSVNIPYLLARYLRLFTSGRKQGEMISGGQFVSRLAENFGLLTEEKL
ncbi:hypothetical protein Tco_1564273 [Tanacetum coccineum]